MFFDNVYHHLLLSIISKIKLKNLPESKAELLKIIRDLQIYFENIDNYFEDANIVLHSYNIEIPNTQS